MTTVSIPELRNNGGAAVERASRGERIVITSSGEPVAELAPLPKRPAHRVALVTARRHLPPVDPEALRCDVDLFIDQSTCPLPDGNPRYQHAATARTDHGPERPARPPAHHRHHPGGTIRGTPRRVQRCRAGRQPATPCAPPRVRGEFHSLRLAILAAASNRDGGSRRSSQSQHGGWGGWRHNANSGSLH